MHYFLIVHKEKMVVAIASDRTVLRESELLIMCDPSSRMWILLTLCSRHCSTLIVLLELSLCFLIPSILVSIL